MPQKFKLYSDMTLMSYHAFNSGRKKQITKQKFSDVQKMLNDECESLMDAETIKAQPIETIGQVYSSSDGYGLSTRARKEIKRLISSYSHIQVKKGEFISWSTFTVPDKINGLPYCPQTDDRIVLDALKSFLKRMSEQGLNSYLWVAERQDGKRNDYKRKTNKIHFHSILVFEKEIDVKILNLRWLYELNKRGFKMFMPAENMVKKLTQGGVKKKKVNGVVLETVVPPLVANKKLIQDYGKTKGLLLVLPKHFEDFTKIMVDEFSKDIDTQSWSKTFRKLPHNLPDSGYCEMIGKFVLNPYDREPLTEFKKVMVYISKYVTKQDENSVVYCRPWACSREFSNLLTGMQLSESEYFEIKEDVSNVFKTKTFVKDISGYKCTFVLDYLNESAKMSEPFKKMIDYIDAHNDRDLKSSAQKINKLLQLPDMPKLGNFEKYQFDCNNSDAKELKAAKGLNDLSVLQLTSVCLLNDNDQIKQLLQTTKQVNFAAVYRSVIRLKPKLKDLVEYI